MRKLMVPALAGLLVTGLIPATAAAQGTAPGAPGAHPSWLPANKTGFGTAHDRGSNVWFTLQGGQMSEVYYPDLSTPSVRSMDFVVTDGRSFAVADNTAKSQQVRRTDDDSLTYEQTITDDQHRWRLRKTYVTDPAATTVLVDVDFQSLTGLPYQLYAVADPDLTNDGSDDSAARKGDALTASDATNAAALTAKPGFTRTSVGYAGASDGGTQLAKTFKLATYDTAGNGNVVLTGQTAADGVRSRRRHPRARHGREGGRRARQRAGVAATRFRRHHPRLRPRLGAVPARGEQTAVVAEDRQRARPLQGVDADAGRERGQAPPGRVHRVAEHAVAVREQRPGVVAVRHLPPGLAARPLPDRDRPRRRMATRRPRAAR